MKSKFAKLLRDTRIAKGLSQQELANEIGIHVNSLRGYESGTHEPSLFYLILIADTLDVSIDWLLGRTKEDK